jgi:hypothetical protein
MGFEGQLLMSPTFEDTRLKKELERNEVMDARRKTATFITTHVVNSTLPFAGS